MPWCPICKNEYKEGITRCADCDSDLVAILENQDENTMVELVSTERKDLLDKFSEYLDYSEIHSYIIEPDEYELVWTMSVSKADFEKSKKLFHGFYKENNDEAEANKTDDDDDETIPFSSPVSSYVRKSDRFTEYRFSAYTCFIVGFFGGVFCILNIFGVFDFVPVLFSQLVLLAVFIAFFLGGIALYNSSNKIRLEISDEENVEKNLKEWLKNNITTEYIDSIRDKDVSDEVNYFSFVEAINEKISFAYPDIPKDMADALIDEHLTDIL